MQGRTTATAIGKENGDKNLPGLPPVGGAASPAGIVATLTSSVIELATEQLSSNGEARSIEPDTRLLDVGFDSFQAVQLVSSVEEKYGVVISPVVAMQLETPALVAGHIAEELPPDAREKLGAQSANGGAALSSITAAIIDAATKLLSSLSPIEATTRLIDVGFDSFQAVQLAEAVEELFGVVLSPVIAMQLETPNAIAVHIEDQVGRRLPTKARTPSVPASAPSPVDSTPLSDAQRDDILAQLEEEGFDDRAYMAGLDHSELVRILIEDIGVAMDVAKKMATFLKSGA